MPRFPYFPYSYYNPSYYSNGFKYNQNNYNKPLLENNCVEQENSTYQRKTLSRL